MRWQITDKGDPEARRLVDGETTGGKPHYSRQTPGASQWTRNGQNLVFITADALAVWATFRPTPGKAKRPDKLDAWECTMFRNEKKVWGLSSELIQEACALTVALWGAYPKDGLITFIRPDRVRSRNPGYCYKMAGWTVDGAASDGKPRLRAPALDPATVPNWRAWRWHGERGGRLRLTLDPPTPRPPDPDPQLALAL